MHRPSLYAHESWTKGKAGRKTRAEQENPFQEAKESQSPKQTGKE